MLRKLAIAALALDLLAGCADQSSDPPADTYVPQFNVGVASSTLADGMTLAAVHNVVGLPSDTSETSRGQDVGQPWTCRVEHYYGGFGCNPTRSPVLEQQGGLWERRIAAACNFERRHWQNRFEKTKSGSASASSGMLAS